MMQGRKSENEIPLVEVKMDSSEVARKIRTEYAQRKKLELTLENFFSQTA
jgi:predicted transposase YbfD/YdcC